MEDRTKKLEKVETKHKTIAQDQMFTELVVGVDPGLKGGVAIFDCVAEKFLTTFPMPTIHNKGERTSYNIATLVDILRRAVPFNPNLRNATCTFCIEKQHPLPEQGVVSMFTTGFGYGLLYGLFSGVMAIYDRIFIVKAQEWQVLLWDEDAPDETKAKSIARVKRLFPDVNLCPDGRRSPSDGIADAVNIAHYAFLRMK